MSFWRRRLLAVHASSRISQAVAKEWTTVGTGGARNGASGCDIPGCSQGVDDSLKGLTSTVKDVESFYQKIIQYKEFPYQDRQMMPSGEFFT